MYHYTKNYFLNDLARWLSCAEIRDIYQNYDLSGVEDLKNKDLSDENRNREINKIRKHRLAEMSLPRLADEAQTEIAAFEFFQLNWILCYHIRKLYIYVDENGMVKANPINFFELAIIRQECSIVEGMMDYCKINLVYYLSPEEEVIQRNKDHSPLKVIIFVDSLEVPDLKSCNKEKRIFGSNLTHSIYSFFSGSKFLYNVNSKEFSALFELYTEICPENTRHTSKFRNPEKHELNFHSASSSLGFIICNRITQDLEKINQDVMKKIFRKGKEVIQKSCGTTSLRRNIYTKFENRFKAFCDVTRSLYVDSHKNGMWGANMTAEIQLKILGFLLGIDFESPNVTKEVNETQRNFVSQQRQIILSRKSQIVKEK